MKHLLLAVPAALVAVVCSTARADADALFQLPQAPRAGYTDFGPRPLDTILCFLRQASVEYPVPGVRDRLKDIIDRLDAEKAVARMVEAPSPDRQHPFARVVVEPDGRPALEYFIPSWTTVAREFLSSDMVDGIKDLAVAATLHGWEHFTLHHSCDHHLSQETVATQESEVWEDMIVNVLAPGRKEHHFLFSAQEDSETYYGLLCFAAAESRFDHPAWKAFLGWVGVPSTGSGVPFCRDVEREKTARL